MRDRRLDSRWTVAASVELQWQDVSGASQRTTGLVQDLSASGVRILVPRPIRVQTPVAVMVQGKELQAMVRYCIRTRIEFMVGIKFRPEHQGVLRSLRKNSATPQAVQG
jgi:hypothetical protein